MYSEGIARKKREFFEIREKFKKIEKYVDLVDVDNRFIELDFWMDDLFFLAKKYFEKKLAQKAEIYKKFHLRKRVISACHQLCCVFEREGWDLGTLEKYKNFYEDEE